MNKKIKEELDKGFMNSFVFGREGYHINEKGELRVLEDNELDPLIEKLADKLCEGYKMQFELPEGYNPLNELTNGKEVV